MVLTDVSVQGSDVARFIGQYGQARILARNVEWDRYQFEQMEIQVKNVRLRPGTRPVLMAAPVLCEGFMRPRPRPAGSPPCRPCSNSCSATASRRSA